MKKFLLLSILLIVGYLFGDESKNSIFDGISISLALNLSKNSGNVADFNYLQEFSTYPVRENNLLSLGKSIGLQKTLKNNFHVKIGIDQRNSKYGNSEFLSIKTIKIYQKYLVINFLKSFPVFTFPNPYSQSNNSINIPIVIEFAYLLNSEQKYYSSSIFGSISETVNLHSISNKYDFGFHIGIEYQPVEKISFGITYYFGFINVFKDVESKNRSLYFNFKYKLS